MLLNIYWRFFFSFLLLILNKLYDLGTNLLYWAMCLVVLSLDETRSSVSYSLAFLRLKKNTALIFASWVIAP